MQKPAHKLRLVEGGSDGDAVTRIYRTLGEIKKLMRIRPDEAIKGSISLKNAFYTDIFYGGSKYKSPRIPSISWLLTIRFLENSWTVASLVTHFAFIIATDTQGNILVMYTVDNEGLKIKFTHTDKHTIDIQGMRDTTWQDAQDFKTHTITSEGKNATPFSPEHLFVHSMETPNSNIIRVIGMTLDRIKRSIEFHGRYNFICKTTPRSKQTAMIDIDDLNAAIDDEEEKGR